MPSEVEKRYLLARAGYRCEYCKSKIKDTHYQIDHIWPESKGGITETSNLAISCIRCNGNKGNHTEWFDPFTWAIYPIFNPRRMIWENHFKYINNEVLGISHVGRGTSSLLFKETSQYVPPDLNWDKIEQLYKNEIIYEFLNDLRYRRLKNDFNTLHKQLINPLPPIEISKQDFEIVKYVKQLLLLELYFTRSNIKDVNCGIKIASNLLNRYKNDIPKKDEILNILSILYQQKATIEFQKGKLNQAKRDQNISFHFYQKRKASHQIKDKVFDNSINFQIFLRTITIKSKYHGLEISGILQYPFYTLSRI